MIKTYNNMYYCVGAFDLIKDLNRGIDDKICKKEINHRDKDDNEYKGYKIRTICAEMLASFALAKSHGATSQRAKTPSG